MPGIEFTGVGSGSIAPPTPPASPWENWEVIEFDSADTYPKDLMGLVTGQVVRAIVIEVESAFNVGIDFTLGSDATTPTSIVPASTIDATEVTSFIFDLNRESAANETLQLHIVGVPTTGSGRIYIDI